MFVMVTNIMTRLFLFLATLLCLAGSAWATGPCLNAPWTGSGGGVLAQTGGTIAGNLTVTGSTSVGNLVSSGSVMASSMDSTGTVVASTQMTTGGFTADYLGNMSGMNLYAMSTTGTHQIGGVSISGSSIKAGNLTLAGQNAATLDSTGHIPLSDIPAGPMIYQGTWNAATNTTSLSGTLVSGTGTKGALYSVAVSGTTSLDGKSQWYVGLEKSKEFYQETAYMSQLFKTPVVGISETCFLDPNEEGAHDVLLCIKNKRYISQEDRPKSSPELCLKSYDEILTSFPKFAIDNTLKIADKCNFILKETTPRLPKFKTNIPEIEELRNMASAGLEKILFSNKIEEKEIEDQKQEISNIIEF